MFKKNNAKKNELQEWKVWFNQGKALLVSADTDHSAAVLAVKKAMCQDGLCVDDTSVNVTVELINNKSTKETSDFGELITVILEVGKPPIWDRRRLPR